MVNYGDCANILEFKRRVEQVVAGYTEGEFPTGKIIAVGVCDADGAWYELCHYVDFGLMFIGNAVSNGCKLIGNIEGVTYTWSGVEFAQFVDIFVY